ncbi:MAG: hypothetical protein IT307_20905 [Chloroflexi bacterium]|nr:hypothetical protein [Chloroflexota bacterium]
MYLRLSSDPSYLGIEKKLRGPELALHLLLGVAGMLLLYVIATKFSEWRSSSYLAIAFLSYTVTIMLWELTVLRPNVDRTGRLYRTISHWLQIDTVLVVLLLIVSAVTYSHVTFCINVWIVALIVLAGALDHMISYDWYLTNDGIARK